MFLSGLISLAFGEVCWCVFGLWFVLVLVSGLFSGGLLPGEFLG